MESLQQLSMTRSRLQPIFFNLPMDEKSGLMSDDVTQPVRYIAMTELKNGEEQICQHLLKQYSHPVEKWIDKWPARPFDYREKMQRYTTEVRNVMLELMEAIMESLSLGCAYLKSQMQEGFEMMAVNCYPPCQNVKDELVLGCAPHTDYSLITLLYQSSEGLQELDRETNSWCLFPHEPGCLLVHVGNYLEVISNGRYKGAVHRVVSGCTGTRVSIAGIPSLAMDERVVVAKELVDEQHPKLYKESTVRDFIAFLSEGRKGSDFMDALKIKEDN